jgi:hypothetical protein
LVTLDLPGSQDTTGFLIRIPVFLLRIPVTLFRFDPLAESGFGQLRERKFRKKDFFKVEERTDFPYIFPQVPEKKDFFKVEKQTDFSYIFPQIFFPNHFP